MSRGMRLARGVARSAAVLALGLAIGLFGLTAVPQVFGWSSYVVLTDSMAPAIATGSVVLVRPTTASDLHPGDVVTFLRAETRTLVTHRVVSLELQGRDDGGWRLRTKGDANAIEDIWDVSGQDVVGRVVVALPGAAPALGIAGSTQLRLLAGLSLIAIVVRNARRSRPVARTEAPAAVPV